MAKEKEPKSELEQQLKPVKAWKTGLIKVTSTLGVIGSITMAGVGVVATIMGLSGRSTRGNTSAELISKGIITSAVNGLLVLPVAIITHQTAKGAARARKAAGTIEENLGEVKGQVDEKQTTGRGR